MNCQKLFQDFNSSKFVVYTSLLIFSILFALRLDQTIMISWWLVFTPLWIWKFLVITGALVGVTVWICNPEYRLSESSYTHFKSMLISLSLQLLLLMFELLVCDKLESDRHFWSLAFIPLIFISLLSVAVSVWALKNERDFELELFCSVNVLQFIFIALRLDRFITWSWVVVFVPLWILLCLAIIGVLYALIFAVILFHTPEVSVEQRKASFYTAIAYILVVLPLLVFFVLLSSKLDSKEFRANGGLFGNGGHFYNTGLLGEPPSTTYGTFNMIHIYSHMPPNSGPNTGVNNNIDGLSNVVTMATNAGQQPFIGQTHHHNHHQQLKMLSTQSPFFVSAYSFDMDYFSIGVPLYFTFSILICMSFSSKGGNLWWFGMRKDFCSFLLILCPCLREYANISYNFNGILSSPNSLEQRNGIEQQNERTNLTQSGLIIVNNLDYDTTDTGGGSSADSKTKHGKKISKKSAITQQPAIIIPNLLRLDIPD
ncbi:transmembrane protein 185a-like protein [Dermatophagoides farinae]|nr:transmembrane protein 185a-like protein [Dermatophagoides farinae]